MTTTTLYLTRSTTRQHGKQQNVFRCRMFQKMFHKFSVFVFSGESAKVAIKKFFDKILYNLCFFIELV